MRPAASIVEDLLSYIDHLENTLGQCDCFDCHMDRQEQEALIKEAREWAKRKKGGAK